LYKTQLLFSAGIAIRPVLGIIKYLFLVLNNV